MPCYYPIPALQLHNGEVILWPKPDQGHRPTANLAIPCQTCIGCLAARANQWGHRCDHEAKLWESNIFVTLTYDDEHLPTTWPPKPYPVGMPNDTLQTGYLYARDLRNFLKRLRKEAGKSTSKNRKRRSALTRDPSAGLRYLACGEYGDLGRPHFHALIFNCGFSDRYRVGGGAGDRRIGSELYSSDTLGRLWGKGYAKFGDASPGRAAHYIAKYSLKNEGAGEHTRDGEWRPAPFLRMSLKPAIGLAWLEKYREDLGGGFLVAQGHRHAIPRTYRETIKKLWPDLAEQIDIRVIRQRQRLGKREDDTPERRAAAEIIQRKTKELTQKRRL